MNILRCYKSWNFVCMSNFLGKIHKKQEKYMYYYIELKNHDKTQASKNFLICSMLFS